MTELLEEVHRATMQCTRAAELYAPLCRPGEKLCVFGWDTWLVDTQKARDQPVQSATYSTKGHCNGFSRMEVCDLEGRPVATFNLCSSCSPRSTDESIAQFLLNLENTAGLGGGIKAVLIGLPGYCVVHLFDNGFR